MARWLVREVQECEVVVVTEGNKRPKAWIVDGQAATNAEDHDRQYTKWEYHDIKRVADDYVLPGGH